jgi:hypothetical protein
MWSEDVYRGCEILQEVWWGKILKNMFISRYLWIPEGFDIILLKY